MRQINLTKGNITGNLLLFALPMMAGNILQQCYNIADTLIVGRYLGANALAAVGSSYTLMTFLTSILLGMCMGSGAVFSICFGQQNEKRLKESILHSFCLIAGTALILNLLVYGSLSVILRFLRVPTEVCADMRAYLQVIFAGITATFLYNFFAALLRAVGNSVVPLIFLGVSVVTNIILDLFFILILNLGVEGAALATVIAQYLSGAGLMLYSLMHFPQWIIRRQELSFRRAVFREIAGLSFLTCAQQSIMNFGILMVQGLVNSFGTVIMAAFAAAVKIDSFAYMPVQDFGNAFSTFIAQNYGAGESERIRKGVRSAVWTSFGFCIAVSALVYCFAPRLMGIFVRAEETQIIEAGVEYLRIEGTFYFGIGLLFLLYGYYRAVKLPGMSVILTVISLGTRVVLAYVLSAIPAVGVKGIWAAVPIGWALADVTGAAYYRKMQKKAADA